jgi:hypothetical protein
MDEPWMQVEVVGEEGTHAASSGSSRALTRCGLVVSFPAGKGEPSCPICREAVGLE